MEDIEKVWNDFWKEICINPDGSINLEQIKKELCDFHFIMQQVPKVYCEITNNKLSKCMYPADVVITEFRDYMETVYDEAFEDAVKGMQEKLNKMAE